MFPHKHVVRLVAVTSRFLYHIRRYIKNVWSLLCVTYFRAYENISSLLYSYERNVTSKTNILNKEFVTVTILNKLIRANIETTSISKLPSKWNYVRCWNTVVEWDIRRRANSGVFCNFVTLIYSGKLDLNTIVIASVIKRASTSRRLGSLTLLNSAFERCNKLANVPTGTPLVMKIYWAE